MADRRTTATNKQQVGRVRTARRQLWLAKINRRDYTLLDHDFQTDVLAALSPDASVTRHGREWRLSKPKYRSGLISGKLGFARPQRLEGLRYDEEAKDFVVETSAAEQGNFAFYVIDVKSQVLAFETRLPDIKRQSFLGAFKKILATGDYRFEVDLLSDERDFERWLSEVDVVTNFRIAIRPPNPSSSQRAEEVRKLIEETNADSVILEAKASEDDGLEVKDSLLGAAAEHAARGNGTFKLTALKGTARRFYNSAHKLVTAQVTIRRDDDEASIVRKLADALRTSLSDRDTGDDG